MEDAVSQLQSSLRICCLDNKDFLTPLTFYLISVMLSGGGFVRTVNSLARIWKVPVMKKRPPFCRVKSWQKKRKRDRQLKMMERIIRACTA